MSETHIWMANRLKELEAENARLREKLEKIKSECELWEKLDNVPNNFGAMLRYAQNRFESIENTILQDSPAPETLPHFVGTARLRAGKRKQEDED